MDEFSLAIAEELFASFPQWRAFARSEQAADGTAYVIVEVPPPPEAHVEHGLVIDTSNGEITVGFDFYRANRVSIAIVSAAGAQQIGDHHGKIFRSASTSR